MGELEETILENGRRVEELENMSNFAATGSRDAEWQDKQTTYFANKEFEVARWFAWASIQNEKVDASIG